MTQRQLIVLASVNLIIMVGKEILNALVVFILIKTRQIVNIACKFIFMLNVSDLMVRLFGQTLFTTMFYMQSCLVARVSVFASVSVTFIFDVFKAVMTTIGLLSDQKLITGTIYVVVDSIILCMIFFLQVLIVQTSNAMNNESKITITGRIDKKITKLSLRIIFLLLFFLTPCHVLHILHSITENKVTKFENSGLEFISVIGMIFIFGNSAANNVLFLTTNMKAKRVLENIKMWR